ncbi:two-component regulator propeller domain-containing protein [Geofilum sp. OHC36d9]|uniref:two-component regulator propeller domain-containing protein n=1 Tax=Geofilum sp. OHC36d9 TaxID=3458413 RepID=UPI004033A334
MRITFFVILLVLGFSLPMMAGHDYIFEHLSVQDGLPHNSVSAMMRDSRGFMWFATWNGVSRYDGEHFANFRPDDGISLITGSNRIEMLREDIYGNVWVRTSDNQMFRFNKFTEQFEALQVLHGRSVHLYIRKALFMGDGEIWLSTHTGEIYRVQTDSVTNHFVLDNFNDLSSLQETSGVGFNLMGADINGGIWMQSSSGLFRLDRFMMEIESVTPPDYQLAEGFHCSAWKSLANWVFCGTNDGRLLVYDLLKDHWLPALKLSESSISCFAVTSGQTVWIGSQGDGVFQYSVMLQEVEAKYSHPHVKDVLKLYPDSKGHIWVETVHPGISKIDVRTKSVRHYAQELEVAPDVRPFAQCGFMEDKEQVLWMTLKGGGFGYYDEVIDEVVYFFNKPGDPARKVSNFVNCFYKDSTGVLWLSTYFKGLEKISFISRDFTHFQPVKQSYLSIDNEVRSILVDRFGLSWVATRKGELFIFDRHFNLLRRFDDLDGEPIGRVYALLEDSEGHVYLGTRGRGLFVLPRRNIMDFESIHFLHQTDNPWSLSNNNIYAFMEREEGEVWIATYGGGINIFRDGRFYNAGNELNYPDGKAQKIRAISADREGNVWLATTEGIVLARKDKADNWCFKRFCRDDGSAPELPGNDVYYVFCDRQGNIWLTTIGGGITCLREIRNVSGVDVLNLTNYGTGSSGNMIYTLAEDEGGDLWMAGDNGISFFNKDLGLIRNFGKYEGLGNAVFSEGAVAKGPGGVLFFGANNGLYFFDPSEFKHEPQTVRMVFTGFRLFGKEVKPGYGAPLQKAVSLRPVIRLKHNENVFTISWTALYFKSQRKMTYRYRLAGFNDQWKTVSGICEADFERIPPGHYKFCVQLIGDDFKSSEGELSLRIVVDSPPWKSSWAFVGYVMLLLILLECTRRIVTTIIRLRNKVVVEQQLSELKLRFFTNISHELRTPLTLILGPASEMLQSGDLSDRGERYLQLIHQNGTRLLHLVNQLLDLRKIQSRKMNLSFLPTELSTFISGVVKRFEAAASNMKVTLVYDGTLCNGVVWLDADKMESVISNLLSNALKFTPEHGRIEVSCRQDILNGFWLIEVRDSGPGVKPSQRERLFELFESYNGQGHRGSGIGLAYSRELVRLHGGELTYHDVPGGGALFRIAIKGVIQPSKVVDVNNSIESASEEEENSPLESAASFDSKPHILVVEDSDDMRQFLRMQLQEHFVVDTAIDGAEGLEQTRILKPDIIVSDVMMPKMDGIEMLDALKMDFETSHIPVILLSARVSVEARLTGLQYGADAYITKPFNNRELLAQIYNLLHQRELLRRRFANGVMNTSDPDKLEMTRPDTDFLEAVRQIVDDNLTRTDFHIEDIYVSLGMGRSKFYDKMKGLTGFSPIDFVKEYRLNKAMELLRSGRYNVSEASFMSGFSDPGYFSKCFKERFGMLPSYMIK